MSNKNKLGDAVLVVQVMERTERLMMKAIVRYREDQDLENAINFIQKKVKKWNDLCLKLFTD